MPLQSQLFPEIESTMLQPLKDAYVYYESKKLEDDLAKDDHNRNKVYRKVLFFTSVSIILIVTINIVIKSLCDFPILR